MAENPRVEELKRRLEREPGSRLFAQYAEELRRAGQLDEAVRVSREGLQRHGGYVTARITLGRSLADLGDLDGAAAEFEEVLRTTPDNLSASRYLGECLEKRGDTAGALRRYEAALQHAPGDEWMRSRVSALGGETRPSAATKVARRGPPPLPKSESDAFTLPGGAQGLAAPTLDLEQGGAVRTASAGAAAGPVPVAVLSVEEKFIVETSEGPMEVGAAASDAEEPTRGTTEAAPVADDEEFELDTAAARPAASGPALTFRPLMPDDTGGAGLGAARGFVPEEAPPAGASELPPMRAVVEAPAPRELASPTLAELYLRQGAADRAAAMYEELLAREPGNSALAQGLAAARARLPVEGRRERVERVVRRLEGLLGAVEQTRARARD